jgi:cytochrome c oxidase subunit 1
MHALVMIFGAVMPAVDGSRELMIPMQVGAPDMALPRLNNFSFWILPFAFTLLLSTLFVPGWFAGRRLDACIRRCRCRVVMASRWPFFAIHLMGASSILGSINVVVTIMNMRAPGVGLLNMPLFCWSWLITGLSADRDDAGAGGRGDHAAHRSLLRHVVLLGLGRRRPGDVPAHLLVLRTPRGVHPDLAGLRHHVEIIPTFSRKPLFGYDAMVYATAAIAFLSFIVWAHHMFTVGMPLAGQLFFTLSTMMISIPTGVKVFNWTATMWKGSLTFEPPMLFALSFLFLFSIGGFSGLMLAVVPADFQYHDTYFVVAHFHYVLVPGAISESWAACITGCRSGPARCTT